MASYYEQIAAWRQTRDQQKIAQRCEEIKNEYREASAQRDQAIRDQDQETAEFCDSDCVELEKEWAQYNPPQPQFDPKAVEFMQRNRPFFQKYGATGAANADKAHQYLMSRGWKPNTKQYYDGVKTLLEMYGKDFGTPYDPNDQTLSANEAARISGLSPERYNHAVKTMWAAGRIGRGNK
jgi:hypothetical protein